MKKKKKKEFSKVLLIQESILVWISTIALIALAFFCVIKGFGASLPWLATLMTGIWSAYGVSAGFYYNKSKAENTKDGVVFEKVKKQLDINGPI